ncbi:hypothetical protein N9D29_06530 [Flavobacteriaceae bacterium]|nr:hypothetical protein [Flavobacteriaceae bacterium]
MKQLHLLYGFLFFLGCQTSPKGSKVVFVGGDIINPSNNYVVLYDTQNNIDTLYLNDDNRFHHHFSNFKPGIHSFVHGGKYQSILLEENDSIMMHINTLDFDESIVYNGIGAKKNNYLINLLLKLEKEDRSTNASFAQSPEYYHQSIETYISKNANDLEAFLKTNPNSDLFKKVALSSIKYHYFTRKELYPFRHFGVNSFSNFKKLPSSFYNFRKEIVYNDIDLKDFYPYYNFLFPHINNLALEQLTTINKEFTLDNNKLEYTTRKLELIDSLVTNTMIKNNLLKYTTRNFIANSKSIDQSYILYQSFLDKSTNVKDKKYIKDLFKNAQGLQPGYPLPAIEVINHTNETLNINTIFENPTVIYFWDNASRYHFENSHIKVKTLQEKFPNVDFISININSMHTYAWKNMILGNQFKINNEYRFADPSYAKKRLAINYIKKVLIVDSKGIILNVTADLFDPSFESLLKEYQ